MQLELSPEEASLVEEILSGYFGDLRMEIADTDSVSFKEGLKKKEVLLKAIPERLQARS